MKRFRFQARAARYDQRVSVYRDVPVVGVVGDGQPVEGATLYCERWAKVAPAPNPGQESYRTDAMQTQADATHRVRVRYDDATKAITPAMWVVLADASRLNIVRATDVDFEHREIELECKERVT